MFELIDDLRDKIWALYNLQLQDLLREQCARPSRGWRRRDPRSSADLNRVLSDRANRDHDRPSTKSHPVVRSRRPSRRPDLRTARRRAQRQSRMAEGHREAARRVLDGREHDGSLARRRTTIPPACATSPSMYGFSPPLTSAASSGGAVPSPRRGASETAVPVARTGCLACAGERDRCNPESLNAASDE